MGTDTAIRAGGLRKHYGGKAALDGFDLEEADQLPYQGLGR